jgi:hypothetical protein
MNMADDVEFQIAKLSLNAEDLLVVRSAKPITSVMAAELMAQIGRRFNLNGRVLVVDAGTELSVVARTDVKAGGKAAAAKT